tara:strand:- start:9788 stop:10600 length:813 start_codon:yes stop_codon:yes gene_type:complete
MNNIKILIGDTIKKELRSRTLLWLFILNIFLIIFVSGGINYITDIVADFGAPMELKNKSIHIINFFVSFWSGIMAIIFGGNCVRSDEDEGVIGQILSLPISRKEYLIGRALGALIISLGFYLVLNLCSLIFVMISGDDFPFLLTFPLGLAANFASIFALIVLSMFISLYSGKLLGFLTTILIYAFLTLAESIFYHKSISEFVTEMGLFKFLSLGMYAIFPHISTLGNIGSKYSVGSNYEGFNYLFEFLHYSVSLGLLLFLLNFCFSKKEI